MAAILDASKKVPMMFRAQVGGRCQLQRIIQKQEPDSVLWVYEWTDKVYPIPPSFGDGVQTKTVRFTWRFVTNSGQDDGVIRPVIGARGYPFFPGSSMKGAFRRVCTPEQAELYCGKRLDGGDFEPGLLRFHGGYPTDDSWTDNLVDIVHPQEDWQVKNQGSHSAFSQISLYQPTFSFGISSAKPLTDEQWETVWSIWQTALEQGLGSRVSAGYGQIATHSGNRLVGFGLSGVGQASKLLDGEGEFRPNLFKAALRGHTRRLFNGITDEGSADQLTKLLWGGIGKGEEATVGLLGIAFNAPNLEIDEWRSPVNRNNIAPIYETGDASLDVLLMRSDLSPEQRDELKQFTIRLIKFAMLLGGFGKSWRRAYHPHFLPDYDRQMIGCHWEFTRRSHPLYIPFNENLTAITKFLDTFHAKGKEFFGLQAIAPPKLPTSGIREAWHQDNVQVWGRLAEDELDSQAIHWLHQPYKSGATIKQSELTGSMGQIGRLWHRMYPRFTSTRNSDGKTTWRPTEHYAELLTIFPKGMNDKQEQQIANDFLRFLDQETDFKRLW